MSVLNKEQLIEKVKTKIGDGTTDEDLELLEDISDTISELEKSSKDTTNWKEKYETLDNEWRERYKARFSGVKNDDENDNKDENENQNLTFDKLFKEG